MFSKRRLFLLLALVLVLPGTFSRVVPANAQDDDHARIYKLALQLHQENVKIRNYTSWVNGNIGVDVAAAPGKIRAGQNMPKFKFNKPGNKGTLENQDLKPPYMLNMWASWCPPCRDEFPMLADGIDSGEINIPVVFVDMSDKRPDASIFLLSIASDVNVAYDDRRPFFAQRYGIDNIPQTILVGADGKVQAIQSGAMTPLSLKFFMEIVAHPGLGAFDADHPDKMPARPKPTPTAAPTKAPDQAIFKPNL